MSGFVSTPAPPAAGDPYLVENDGWYPDVDLNLLRADVRIDSAATVERLRSAAVEAMVAVAGELADWRAEREAEGEATFAGIDGPTFGGDKRQVVLYRRAIQSFVAADLGQRLLDAGLSEAGHDRAEALREAVGEHLAAARKAISDIVEEPSVTVELI